MLGMDIATCSEMCEVLVAEHSGVLMTDRGEPCQRFLERISRDRLLHDAVLVFQVGEVHLRSATIVMRSGFCSQAEQLPNISKAEEFPNVSSEEDARVHAIWH